MRRTYRKKTIYLAISIITLVIFLYPNIGGYINYDHVDRVDILRYLHKETTENITIRSVANCNYSNVINEETLLSPNLVDSHLMQNHGILYGGEYSPQNCTPKFSTAIIVPYRDRAEQLQGFLVYMHTYFRHQYIHYRIFIIEQVNSRLFNRGKLMNIGALEAIKAGFPCLILHDVDLLPLSPANLYACTELPRHMSSSIDKFRYILPYLKLFGGAIAILSKQFLAVNGMSNEYYGWGGEDDDLYSRLEANNIKICRFGPDISKYHMLKHESQKKGENRKKLLNFASKRIAIDGLSSLHYVEVSKVLHPLFTHIMVDL